MDFDIAIKHQDTTVKVRPLFAKSDHVFIDADGAIYQKTWKREKRTGTTPAQRKKIKYTKDDIAYNKFSDGILSLRRSLLYGMHSGSVAIVTHKDWLELVEQFHDDILVFNLEEWSGYVRLLSEAAQEMKTLKTPPMHEVRAQLVSIIQLQDVQGRVNISALCCRGVAVQERIIERLKTLRAWQAHFTTQSVLIENEWKKFQKFTLELGEFVNAKRERTLKYLSGNEELGALTSLSNFFHRATYYASYTIFPRDLTQLASVLDELICALNARDKKGIARMLRQVREILTFISILVTLEGVKISVGLAQQPPHAYVRSLDLLRRKLDTLHKKSGSQWVRMRVMMIRRGIVGAIAASTETASQFEKAVSKI